MSNKKEEVVDKFLEDKNKNMDYLFCILACRESERLSMLPDSVKKTFRKKITTMSLEHVALNNVPDYIVEEIENNATKEDTDFEYVEEYQDDSGTLINSYDNFDDEDVFDDDEDLEDEDAFED